MTIHKVKVNVHANILAERKLQTSSSTFYNKESSRSGLFFDTFLDILYHVWEDGA